MKSTKESPIMVNNCLMFPYVYGYRSHDFVSRIEQLEIKRPPKSKTFAKKAIGLEAKHLFKIYEIEGVRDLSIKKCALFNFNDGELGDEIQYGALSKSLEESRKIIKE